MAKTEMQKTEAQPVTASQAPVYETTYVPDVDILEDRDRILLRADMPGVDRKSVEVTVEHNVLTIEGHAAVTAPEGYELVGQEVGAARYRRDFTLSDTVNTNGIKANVRHGVLELILPKKEEVKTRKIQVDA